VQKAPFPRIAVGFALSLALLIILAPSHQAFGRSRWVRPLSTSPSSINFGSVPVGTNVSQTEIVTNTRSYPVYIAQAAISGTGFSLSPLNLPLKLAAGESATLSLGFRPPSASSYSGTLQISVKRYDGGRWRYDSAWVPLAGTGTGTGTSQGQLTPSPTSLSFGSVQVSKTSTLPFTLTNNQATAVQVSNLAASGAGFSVSGFSLPINLAAGQSVSVNVNYTPSATGTSNGSVAVTSNANNPSLSIALTGTGASSGQLAASPTSLSFGSVQVSKSSTLPFTLTNNQSTGVQISSVKASGTGFSVSGFTLPINLSAGQSVTVNATFAPSSSGAVSGSVAVSSDANNPSLSVSLSGTGASSGTLAISPTSLSFGSVNVGSSKNMTGTLTASSSSVTVSSASWNGPGFSVSGVSFPVTVAAGQSLPFTVTFSPTTAGSATGLVSFVSNAGNTPTNESLTGSGAAVTQHSVSLSWNPDASTVQGYYVYRGSQSGGPYTRISSLLPSASYTDSTVASSQTYFYVVTALGTNSAESGYSNEAVATIP
jgi:hypothetical protein